MLNDSCKICDNALNNEIHKVREMYFGLRDEFDYLECAECGCLQLLNPPEDYSIYYPKEYFTFQQKVEGKIKSFFNRYRDRAAMGKRSLVGSILYKYFGEPTYINRLKKANIGFGDSILDVGCGKGILLYKMKQSGFNNVIGIDPYLNNDIFYKNGLKVFRNDIQEIDGKFNFIMFNHSFEHLVNPFETLRQTHKLLNDNKYTLIRIPVADSFAWKKYGVNWSSLEAPRHIFLHTKRSIELLASKTGFKVDKISYDSRSWQFWGSEQYANDVHLLADNSYYVNPKKSMFTTEQIDEFENETRRLNEIGEGDQAEFYLKKI
ncbi:MAG: class I SAM-dependent methyltransferase [Ignavibacteriaceae bacterium]